MKHLRRHPAMGRVRQVHMVGIGGIGMSSIAEVLLHRGFRVTGSDLHLSDVTRRLEALGAIIYQGHDARHVQGADVVVYSSAVDVATNPETQEALRQRIPLISRAEMLGELMRMKYGVGVAGTHGKTTTTSMVGLVLAEAGFDPTIIVGGKVAQFGSNALHGEGDVIVIEADEYDRTFLRLTPVLAVITNVEPEHMDIYRDEEDLKQAFIQYANSVPFFGATIVCLDDPGVQGMIDAIDRRIITYGTTRQADVRAEHIQPEGRHTRFTVYHGPKALGHIRLQVPGRHNVLNALAAVAVGLEMDVPFEHIRAGVEAFKGVHRRFDVKGEVGGVLVMDDYAHHPTEVRATLEAVHQSWPQRRVVAVFQPHLYSRTQMFAEEFARAFLDADVLVVTDIYPAREEPLEGVRAARIVEWARSFGHRQVHYVPEKTDIPGALQTIVQPGDVVLTVGAGDIWRYGEAFLRQLQEKMAQ